MRRLRTNLEHLRYLRVRHGYRLTTLEELEAAGLPTDNATVALLYFALCLTLSSTILVIGTLKNSGQMETAHGQVALGLMVIQDIVAVVALAILGSLKPLPPGSPAPNLGLDVGLIFDDWSF